MNWFNTVARWAKLSMAVFVLFVGAVVFLPYPTGQALDELMNVLSGAAEYTQHVSTLHGLLEPVSTEIEGPIDLRIISGSIPEDIDGVFLRVGPNELTGGNHGRMTYHLFDGHGLVHVVSLNGKTQKATYSRSWLKTPRFLIEKEKGRDVFERLGNFFLPYLPFRLMTQAIKRRAFHVPRLQQGPANTNIKLIDGRLFALNEGSLPFEFSLRHVGHGYAVDSIGYEDFDEKLDEPVTAHPRQDPHTGATVFVSYNPMTHVFPVGEIHKNELVSMQKIHGRHPGAIGWAHDAAITENYIVIPDGGSLFDVKSIRRGIFIELISTLGFTVVPRNKTEALTGGSFAVTSDLAESILHIATAWETEDSIVVVAPKSADLRGIPVNKDTLAYSKFEFSKMTLPKRAGLIKFETIESPLCSPEFPRVNPLLDGGYKIRFAFASCLSEPGDKREGPLYFTGWAKFDLESKTMSYVPIPGDWVIGELAPIPKHDESNPRMGGTVEDGSDAVWLVDIMANAITRESRVVIYDGESPSEEPVAVLGVPERIPAGFHSQFYSQITLNKQGHFSRPSEPVEQQSGQEASDEL